MNKVKENTLIKKNHHIYVEPPNTTIVQNYMGFWVGGDGEGIFEFVFTTVNTLTNRQCINHCGPLKTEKESSEDRPYTEY